MSLTTDNKGCQLPCILIALDFVSSAQNKYCHKDSGQLAVKGNGLSPFLCLFCHFQLFRLQTKQDITSFQKLLILIVSTFESKLCITKTVLEGYLVLSRYSAHHPNLRGDGILKIQSIVNCIEIMVESSSESHRRAKRNIDKNSQFIKFLLIKFFKTDLTS